MTTPTIRISINFTTVDAATASVPVLDHGFLFGDSIYEVVRTWRGCLIFVAEHMTRLRASARGIGLPVPHDDATYQAEMERMHAALGAPESYLRLIITRGVGDLELATHSCLQQNVIFIAKPLKVWDTALYRDGAKLALVGVVRNSRRSMNPAFKTGNYLNNVLAIEEARRSKATEALMLNARGEVTECTTSNVFAVRSGEVITPPLDAGILSGITRAQVLTICREQGIPHAERSLAPQALLSADECFITSTTRDVMPITQINDARIGNGSVGPVSKLLMEAYRAHCDAAVSA